MSLNNKTVCKVNDDGSVSLEAILNSFNAPISEERAWALCYQVAKFLLDNLVVDGRRRTFDRSRCYLIFDVNDFYLKEDGNVHAATLFGRGIAAEDAKRRPLTDNDLDLINGLGLVVYNALDRSNDHDEERAIGPELESLIGAMVMTGEERDEDAVVLETDDEGIEKDSDVYDECPTSTSSTLGRSIRAKPSSTTGAQRGGGNKMTLETIVQKCERHLAVLSKSQAEIHYRAVVRALIAEAIELTTFLETVSRNDLIIVGAASSSTNRRDLERLQFADWARYWMQVIAELRLGVKLKKVNYVKAPIEYELTPYEILMKDIRSCRYRLRKTNNAGNSGSRVTKDAHAIILEFIRSRPPLKRAADRKLAPPRTRKLTPREQLMHSIRKGSKLRKTATRTRYSLSPPRVNGAPNGEEEGERKRRVIKVDFASIFDDDDDDEDSNQDVDDDEDEEDEEEESAMDLWSQAEPSDPHAVAALEAYDLAMADRCAATGTVDYKRPRANKNERLSLLTQRCHDHHHGKSHVTSTTTSHAPCNSGGGSRSVPQSRPCSRQSCASDEVAATPISAEMARAIITSTSDSSGAIDGDKKKSWQHEMPPLDNLTLDEIVHIRTVLTKADLETLPTEGRVKSDAENRKVCFLCLKTRFGLLGPWGSRCAICKRTVCSRCCSKMMVPIERFAAVPVVLLSPSIMATPVDDEDVAYPTFTRFAAPSLDGACSNSSSRSNSVVGANQSTPSPSSSSTPSSTINRFKSTQTIVCHDCKMMVMQIIKSAQENRAANRNRTLQGLTLNVSPVF